MDTFEKIKFECKIMSALNSNNGKGNTFHFIWDEDTESVQLEIVSCHPKTHQIFLLLLQTGDSYEECLKLALEKVTADNLPDYSWIITWIDSDNKKHISYFSGKNVSEIENKFYYGNIDARILSIERQPLS